MLDLLDGLRFALGRPRAAGSLICPRARANNDARPKLMTRSYPAAVAEVGLPFGRRVGRSDERACTHPA